MHSCLTRVPIFQELSPEEMNQVHGYISPKSLTRGEYAQIAGEYSPRLMILNRGKAKVSRTSLDGEEQIIRVLKPGDYIGEMSVFAGSAANYDVQLLEDSTFCTLNKQHLSDMIKGSPTLALKVLGDMSRRLELAEAQIESLALKSADERLFGWLEDYSKGQKTFELKVAKKQIATEIGVRPETISRSLRSLELELRIDTNGKLITINRA